MSELAKQNNPELRFAEFKNDWEVKTLGDFFTFKNGINADKSMYGQGHKFINVLDIINDQPIVYSGIIGSVSVSEAELKKNEVVYGDILFQRSSETREEVGQNNVYLDPNLSATFGGFVIRGRPISNFNSIYFNLLLKTQAARKDITAKSGGSTRYNVGQESLSTVKVNIAPSIPEQEKIAVFLSATDEKIVQLQEKKTLLEAYKKGCMQKLFSQTLRFKDDNGNDYPDWACINAGELFQNISNKNHSGELPILAITQDMGATLRDNLEKDIFSSADSVQSYKIVEPGDFIISLRSFQGGLEYSKILGICSPAYTILRSTKPICDGFFKNYFKKEDFISRLSATVVGIREGKQISYGAFSTLTLPFPSLEEQQKIADFLSAIDDKITHATAQLEHAKTFKKGLLQKMFV